MESVYTAYLSVIRRNSCPSSDTDIVILPEEAKALADLSLEHRTAPFLLPFLHGTDCYPSLKQQTKSMMLNYYQIEHFTRYTVSLLAEHHISCYLLKGLSLADCYPVPEYRKLGDLDLYINDKDAFAQAKRILEAQGYIDEEELSDHHVTYRYRFSKTGRDFLLELHYRIVGLYQYSRANEIVDEVFSSDHLGRCEQIIHGYTYTILPPSEYVFYQIHHMLKHYLYDGFGIRLLCDFSLYVEKNGKDIDFPQLNEWCSKSGMAYFFATIMDCCKKYLGLSKMIPGMLSIPENECDQFMTQILGGHEVGNEKQSSLVYSGTYRRANLLACFKEGHTQMKVRFPKLGRIVPIWPVLWGFTFYHFLKNTYRVRNTTLRQTIKDFKTDNQRAENLHLFEKKD